jgi:MSHA pilin protein MshD
LKLRKSGGVSLIELLVSIVVIGVAVAGVLGALSIAARTSADPMIQKQALAIAEAFLEEAQLMPFTFCDPDDPNAAAAQGAADCTGGPGGANDEGRTPLGPEAGEDRYSTITPFDNVSDYNGYDSNTDAPPGIKDINQAPIAGLEGYLVSVSVAGQALATVAAGSALLITVTVTGPGGTTIRLDGYRARYAPNATLP